MDSKLGQILNIIPTVIETGARGERAFDIFSLLLKERIVFLGTPIDDQIANLIIAQLLYLDREDPEKDIQMYIHSPGGVITRAWRSTTRCSSSHAEVSTICVGRLREHGDGAACAGAKGKRYACRTRRSTCTRRWAVRGAARPTSRSRRARSCATSRPSARSSPATPARTSSALRGLRPRLLAGCEVRQGIRHRGRIAHPAGIIKPGSTLVPAV